MALQKPEETSRGLVLPTEPRILEYPKQNNNKGSVYGKISAYQELWNFVEVLRCENHNSEGNMKNFKIKNDVITQVHSNIIKQLKSLGCEVEDLNESEEINGSR